MQANTVVQANRKGKTATVFAIVQIPDPYRPFPRSRIKTARSSRKAGIPETDIKPKKATEKK